MDNRLYLSYVLTRGNKLVGWGDTPSAAKSKARIMKHSEDEISRSRLHFSDLKKESRLSNYELMMHKLEKTTRHNTYKRAGRRSKVARHSPRR